MSERSYVVGAPVAVTVHEDGRVTLDVDLSEVDDFDCYDRAWDKQADDDRTTVSEAAARLGNCLTMTINRARPTA